jgi:hypothetical protein
MTTPLTAQPTLFKTPGSVLPIAISFVAELTAGDTLTGTPTITVSPSGPIVSAPAINSDAIEIEIEGNRHWAQPGQAVLCMVAGGAVNGDGSAKAYSLLVTVSSEGGAVWDRRPVNLLVSND